MNKPYSYEYNTITNPLTNSLKIKFDMPDLSLFIPHKRHDSPLINKGSDLFKCLSEDAVHELNRFYSIVLGDSRASLSSIVERFISRGIELHCPGCLSPLVRDGGTGRKEDYTRDPTRRQFRCVKCGRKYVFSSTFEGIIVRAVLVVRDFLINMGENKRAVRNVIEIIENMFHATIGRPLPGSVVLIHVDSSFRNRRVIIGVVALGDGDECSGEMRRFIIAGCEDERGVEALLRSALSLCDLREGEGLVVVSDGSRSIRAAVRNVLPKSIHIRQFHGEQRGLVLIHTLFNSRLSRPIHPPHKMGHTVR